MTTDADEFVRVNLLGQSALVTGGGKGIGRSIAQALGQAGAKVAVVARTAADLEETVAWITGSGGQAIALAADVTDRTAVENMVAEVERKLGPVDLLVNNAAVSAATGPCWEVDPDLWWRVMDVNVRGPMLCARAVLPSMIARRRGRIVNVSSGSAVTPAPGGAPYGVSKAALNCFTDSLAAATKTYGVSIFAISPGRVWTPMQAAGWANRKAPDGGPVKGPHDTPFTDWVPPERAAQLVLRLASGEADQISGRHVSVRDNLDELLQRLDEIERDDLLKLRFRVMAR
jgi:NAD(P)-dependent dehydrogenase (short-subunit alcohol dehydrogenase family)